MSRIVWVDFVYTTTESYAVRVDDDATLSDIMSAMKGSTMTRLPVAEESTGPTIEVGFPPSAAELEWIEDDIIDLTEGEN